LVSQSRANAPAGRVETIGDLLRPVALTVRLDPERYAKLSAYAAGFTPRRSFQAIMVAALDAYLAEQGQGKVAAR
jgi:predicted transcriptional regulator